MVASVVTVFIDWGFTRLKLRATNEQGLPFGDVFYYTQDIASNPEFYSHSDLQSIKKLLACFLCDLPSSTELRLYLCSQMHCLAGVLASGDMFLSTWNDLPLKVCDEENVRFLDGIPLLHSMPHNKVLLRNEGLFLSSSLAKDLFATDELPISYLASPLTLVLSDLLGVVLPCSWAWWQSCCLSETAFDIPLCASTYLSERPLILQRKLLAGRLALSSDLVIYPEVGDLQASTIKAVEASDVVINLGTGSQVVFPNLNVNDPSPFYRYWSSLNKSLVTVSHVPCGRLLAAYASCNGLSYGSLVDHLDDLKGVQLERLVTNNLLPILFFPGYCFVARRYLHSPPASLLQLASLPLDIVLSMWIYQYASIMSDLLRLGPQDTRSFDIAVTGNLGGLAPGFLRCLAELMLHSSSASFNIYPA